MIVLRNVKKVREIINKVKKRGDTVGFIPTMGALHEGHISLIKEAKKNTSFVVVSIFVNPTQFGPHEDYRKYPRNFKKDKEILKQEGVDLIFYPNVKAMYSKKFSTYVEEIELSKYLCGKRRPGHFKGVCTIVAKLFNIVLPDIAYFGQKDYQQAVIIKRMVKDLNFSLKIKVMPIVREKDGLALSSRNTYLTSHQRKEALSLYHALKLAYRMVKNKKQPPTIIKAMQKLIKKEAPSSKIDYINIVDPFTLQDVRKIEKRVLVALAIYIGKARLIDNMLIKR